jgi:3-methyladenine DNA glycosylase/8-oxoguanine DNA glycosylase
VLGRRTARVIRTGDHPLIAQWHQEGDDVAIELFASGDAGDLEEAFATAIGIAGLDDDPRAFNELSRAHPTVAALHRRFGGTRLARTATIFETFATAVIQQLVTYEEASASIRRLIYRYGQKIGDFTAFPTAEVVAAIPPHDLRALGIGIRRATTLLKGAQRGKALERLRQFPAEEAIERVTSLRGVGVWTANKIAVEALGYADGVLVRDAVLPFTITMALTGTAGGDDEMVAALEPFRPHRARVTRLIHLAQLFDHQIAGVPRKPLPTIDEHRRYPWRS